MNTYNKATVFRLYPTTEQETLFLKTIGCCRFVYNYLLDLKIKNHQRYKDGKKQKPLPTEKANLDLSVLIAGLS